MKCSMMDSDDFIAGFDAFAAEGISDKVDCLGGIAGKDDFFLASPAFRNARTVSRARLVGLGRLVCEIVKTAMHVGILLGIGLLQPIEDLLWLLRRRRRCRGRPAGLP